mmetsp:Transcript_20114/g.56551  ORF Transcript_20114/g.56551 Transcript_20114/m.56551 type:complete len:171 (+) Transcript_20114:87-599(+)
MVSQVRPSEGRRLSQSKDEDFEMVNRNTGYLEDWRMWPLYVGLVLGGYSVLSFFFTTAVSWILVHNAHNIITFVLFHWVKGVPFSDIYKVQGKYDKLTLWEQLDNGVQYSSTRKFFTAELIILYLFVLHLSIENGYGVLVFIVNTATFLPCMIGKLPFMNRVRILGINKD